MPVRCVSDSRAITQTFPPHNESGSEGLGSSSSAASLPTFFFFGRESIARQGKFMRAARRYCECARLKQKLQGVSLRLISYA